MPFPDQNPGEFTRTSILDIKPDQMGVYGLFEQGRWIYIGSGDIRDRLLAHLGGDNACITREGPTHWVNELTGNYVDREKKLIVEHDPSCNKKIG